MLTHVYVLPILVVSGVGRLQVMWLLYTFVCF